MSLQVSKKKAFLTINVLGNKEITGNIFLSPQSKLRYGEELIIDLLNDKTLFFPFEEEETSSIKIVNKKNIISITVSEDIPSEEELGKREKITVALIDGRRIMGDLIIDQPDYRSRVLDFFNAEERQFFKLLGKSETYYLNIAHVSEVIPS